MKKFCFFLLIVFLLPFKANAVLSKEDNEKFKTLVRQGQAILEKDPKSAEAFFSNALQIERRDVALKGLGWAYWKQDRSDKALPIWKELVEKNPTDMRLKNQLAKLFVEQKLMPEAERTYRQVLQKEPSNVDALIGMAGVMNYNHDYAAAQSIFQNLSRQKSIPTDRYMKAWGLSLFEGRKYPEALPKWEYVVDHNPKDISSMAYLGRTLYHLGQYEKAMPLLKKVTQQDPGNIKALETQLLYAKFQKNTDESKRLLNLLIDTSPKNTIYLNYYAAVLMANKEYDKAILMFERSLAVDPNQVDPRISITEINGLKGMGPEETQLYRKALLARFPNIGPRISHGILDAYEINQNGDVPGDVSANMDFSSNSDLESSDLRTILKKYPGDLSVQLRLAKLEAEQKNYDEAFNLLNQIEVAKFSGTDTGNSSVSIPSLLYHRVTLQQGEGVLTSAQFEDQLKALKNAGYESISVKDLDSFYKGKAKLPEHPILLTFDDAIKEVMTYADPILEKYGYKATMFVPTHVIENKKSFFMSWDELTALRKTGRWDIQCHSDYGHEPITTDRTGHTGRFLVNRKWLEKENVLESEDDFRSRIERDYITCKENLQNKFPGLEVIAYSFPYGDFGTESSTNSKQDVAEINLNAVKKNFDLAFVQRYPGFNIASTPPYLSMRINVNETWNGNDLLEHLKTEDPIVKAKSERANILLKKGDQKAAIKLAQDEDLQHKDPKTYYKTLSTAYEDMGNSIEAIRALDQSGLTNENIQFHRQELASALAPEAQFSLDTVRDNSSRTLWKPAVHARSYLMDHFFARAVYAHGFFEEDRPIVPVAERKAQSDTFGMGLEYYWDDATQINGVAGFQEFDTGLLSFFANGSMTIPMIKDIMSFTASGNHQVLELARAIHKEITQTDMRGGITGKPTDNLYYRFLFQQKWLSDKNRVYRISDRIRYKIYNPAGLYVGAYFDYQDSTNVSPYYYSPQKSRQGLGEIGTGKSWNKYLRTNISTRMGAGDSASNPVLFVQEYAVDVECRVGKNSSIETEVEYGKQPGYSAVYGTLTFSTQF